MGLLCLASVSIMCLRFIWDIACVGTLSLFIAKEYEIVWMDYILLVCLPAGGHSSCFHFLPVMNSAAKNTYVQVFVWIKSFFLTGRYIRVELLGLMVNFMFNFSKTVKLFSKVAAPFCIPSNRDRKSPFLHVLTSTYYCPSGCEVVSLCGFNLYFTNN